MKTVNLTVKIDPHELTKFEAFMRHNIEVISFKVIPDTEKLYDENDTFRKLVKNVKTAQTIRDKYINEHNNPNN